MNKSLLYLFFFFLPAVMLAQQVPPQEDTSWKKIHRYTPEKINDLVHTKLDLVPDYSKSYVYGKAWITLTPHFYPTDTLRLDAKGMDIKKVSIVKSKTSEVPLKFDYDGLSLMIKLDRTYRRNEKYTLYIDYTAKPDEFEAKMGNKLLGVKGFYFINPKGEDKTKPTQIWTQGETEANSAWFPTIDHTNQKTTEELTVTVPDKYVTLSNGQLVSQKKNANGTRTDYWKMDLPHAPYLFFLGVGDYSVTKDSWKGKEVSYYVEKEYGPVARKIFGNTPEMMSFFSKITGVDFPWYKYSQITGRDYVAGAMENTTATLHAENAQQDARQLIDGNGWETVIAHELFHQWFGDYVTTENWTNLTLNESFADYSQTLWEEYKYGKDAGDAENFSGLQQYLSSPESAEKHLVRFYYKSPEEMFDLLSYQKGGRVLHMLRNYVGDSAFFKALNLYLTTNKFKSAEAQQLRLAFEEVTGRDLTWYFNQWYYGNGHPKLDIDYQYDDAGKKVNVIVKQTQAVGGIFRLPVAIDIYQGGKMVRQKVWAENAVDSFSFQVAGKPDLVNFDGDKTLLCEKKENKTLDNYLFQYKYAGKYLDRREAIDYISKHQDDPKAVAFLKTALKDPYSGLRNFTLAKLDLKKPAVKTEMEPAIADLAKNDPKSTVRGRAIGLLAEYKKPEYKSLFQKALNDSSYTVAGNALEALYHIDSAGALTEAARLAKYPSKDKLEQAILNVNIMAGNVEAFDMVIGKFEQAPISGQKFNSLQLISDYLAKINDTQKVKRGVDDIVTFRDAIPEAYRSQTDPYINNVILQGLAKKKMDAGLKDQADYISSKIPQKSFNP